MRINFKTSSVPTRAAKRLKSLLSIKESTAREWTAQVFGYRNWHELIESLGTLRPSALDEDCTRDVLKARHRYQAERLGQCLASHSAPLPDKQSDALIETWRPSAQYPNMPIIGLFKAPLKRISRSVVLGDDELPVLKDMSPAVLANLPESGHPWLDRDACSVARKLLREGPPTTKPFARQVLAELHARGSFAGTLHFAASLMRAEDGAVNHALAGQLLGQLLSNGETPPNIRAFATEGEATLQGVGAGWPVDLAKAVKAWEEGAQKGEGRAAYLVALVYDPLKPQTCQLRPNPEKAITHYRMAAMAGQPDAAVAAALLLAGFPEFASHSDEGVDWLKVAAWQGDSRAQEFMSAVDASEAWIEALPEKVGKSVVRSLMEKLIPASDRGEPVVVPELGEVVFIPPTCWIQLSTGALFAKENERFESIAGGHLAPDILRSYPRGPSEDLDRAGWVISVGETLNRFLPHILERERVKKLERA